MNGVLDFVRHPQLVGRDRWREIESPVGKLSALLPPPDIEGVEPVMGAVPAVSEHTESILKELDYTNADIETLRQRGVV
jgi:crotonobetainyl-CoA:carnitine CoA-transferase CaiB-like acyl-CoA transferase